MQRTNRVSSLQRVTVTFACVLVSAISASLLTTNRSFAQSVHGLGWRRDTPSMTAGRLAAMPPSAPLPASIDLTASFPPPGDQGASSSCVGWATGYAVKSYHERTEEKWPLQSVDHRFSPSWVYNQINGGVDNGSYISDALNLIVSKGSDVLTLFTFNAANVTTQPDTKSFARAAHFKASTWSTVSVTANDFKSGLAAGIPIIIGFEVLPDFDGLNAANSIYDTAAGTNPPTCTVAPCSRGGHAVAIIGYDDAISAFKFINSWGTGWGVGGYGWLAYNFITNASLNLQAFALMDSVNVAGYMDSTRIWAVTQQPTLAM